MKNIILTIVILLYAYPFGFIISSLILRKILIFVDASNTPKLGGKGLHYRNESFWIGICEHFLVVSFILSNQFTALGILFAARGIVRSENIKEKPSFFLLGMLLSLCFATFFAMTAQIFLRLFDIPLLHLIQ